MEFRLGWLQDLLLADPCGHPPFSLWVETRLFSVTGILFILLDPKFTEKCGKRQEKVPKRWKWEWRHNPHCAGGWTIQAPECSLGWDSSASKLSFSWQRCRSCC